VQLDRAAEVELVRLLERDVEEAEVLELLCTGERPLPEVFERVD